MDDQMEGNMAIFSPIFRTSLVALGLAAATAVPAQAPSLAMLDRLGIEYDTVDVLQDMEIRQGIKEFSDWPTIPQLYVKGEFIGGSDIMMEMWEAGELHQLMNGIPTRAE